MSNRCASLGIPFGSLVLFAFLVGCHSSTGGLSNTAGGAVGSVGGATNSAGGAQAATGGALASVGTGGAPSGTTGGATAALGGSTLAGSSATDCNPPQTTYCTGTVPPAALISDFSVAAGATTPVVFGTWGQSIYGGSYAYPGAAPSCETGAVSPYPLTQTLTGGNWNVRGTVGTYSGGGLWWSCNTATAAPASYASACTIDASAYTGISFTISGSIGPVPTGSGTVGLTMAVSTPSTTPPKTDSAGNPKNCGTCAATACGSSVLVPVTATPTTVALTWAQLGVTAPNAITGISFSFTDPFGLNGGYATTPPTPTPYPVDITIDDLQFTP
jgi:hypothetical protein